MSAEVPPAIAATSASPPPQGQSAASAPAHDASLITPHSADLNEAYSLLQRATNDLTRGKGAVRDSDVKRRMLELRPGFDEGAYGFSKFSRFLRQAHDAEVINLNQVENGSYEVTLGDKAGSFRDARGRPEPGAPREAVPASASAEGTDADREERPRRGRGRERGRRPERLDRTERGASDQISTSAVDSVQPEPMKQEAASAVERAEVKAPAASATPVAPARSVTMGFRRGSRGGPVVTPPPILPGQTVTPKTDITSNGGAAVTETAPRPAATKAKTERAPRRREAKPESAEVTAPQVSVGELPLPADETAIVDRFAGYKGVGRKSAEAIVQAFGADHVFHVLHEQPERVRQMLGGRRAELLLKGWQLDYADLTGASRRKPVAKRSARKGEQIEVFTPDASGGRKRSRGSRGGARKKKDSVET